MAEQKSIEEFFKELGMRESIGKNGIYSKEDFLKSPSAQEDAVRAYEKSQWNQITKCGGEKYLGKSFNGITVTKSGLVAAAHLVGPSKACSYLAYNGKRIYKDGNGTSIEE